MGKEFAQNTDANPDSIGSGLDNIYGSFLKRQKLDKDAIKTKIEELGNKIITIKKILKKKRKNKGNFHH